MMRTIKILAYCGVSILVSGCGDAQLTQLETTLTDIGRSPRGNVPLMITPLPEPQPLSAGYEEVRSPFRVPGSGSDLDEDREGVSLPERHPWPIEQRPLEPLEYFSLSSLRLVGTLSMGDQSVALIASPDGQVASVRKGSYLGSQHGQVTHIRSRQITIVERTFHQPVGWQENRAVLSIDE